MSDNMFRAEALEAQSRFDALPRTMRVATGMTRAVLMGLGAALIGAVVWSGFVVVPISVSGQGILIDASGELLVPARSTSTGVVDQILVRPGDQVEAHQPIARVLLSDLMVSIEETEKKITSLEERAARTTELQEAERIAEARIRRIEQSTLSAKLDVLESRVLSLSESEENIFRLMRQGLAVRSQFVEAKTRTQSAETERASVKAQLHELEAESLAAEGRREREQLSLGFDIESARSELASLNERLRTAGTITAPVHGEIAEIAAGQGTLLSAGHPVASILPSRRDQPGAIEAVVFVNLADGKRVAPDDTVLIAPNSLEAGTHDRVRARVLRVAQTPATHESLTQILGNESLSARAMQAGPLFTVNVRLEEDAATPSGYRWTSGTGPDVRLTPGTPLDAEVTVERKPLLSLALPAFRRLFELNKAQAATDAPAQAMLR
ncbi:MAG: NHLP bacteriocin system secretion protein [Pseudomonadota bacterium]